MRMYRTALRRPATLVATEVPSPSKAGCATSSRERRSPCRSVARSASEVPYPVSMRGGADGSAEESETAHSQAAECHSVDDVAMAALNASVALSQSHAQLTEWLTSKANVSDVESLTQDVSRKVSVAELAAVSAALSGKAEEPSGVERLAEKVDRADVLEMLSEKANASAVTALQAGKADATTVDALSTVVAGKVDQSALSSLAGVVDGKVAASELAAVLADMQALQLEVDELRAASSRSRRCLS